MDCYFKGDPPMNQTTLWDFLQKCSNCGFVHTINTPLEKGQIRFCFCSNAIERNCE